MPGKYGILDELSPADNQKVDNQPITGNAPMESITGILVIEIEINFDSPRLWRYIHLLTVVLSWNMTVLKFPLLYLEIRCK